MGDRGSRRSSAAAGQLAACQAWQARPTTTATTTATTPHAQVGLMIGAEVDPAKRDEYLMRLMGPPNAIWSSILQQVGRMGWGRGAGPACCRPGVAVRLCGHACADRLRLRGGAPWAAGMMPRASAPHPGWRVRQRSDVAEQHGRAC
jgi:hypothetical protein